MDAVILPILMSLLSVVKLNSLLLHHRSDGGVKQKGFVVFFCPLQSCDVETWQLKCIIFKYVANQTICNIESFFFL